METAQRSHFAGLNSGEFKSSDLAFSMRLKRITEKLLDIIADLQRQVFMPQRPHMFPILHASSAYYGSIGSNWLNSFTAGGIF